MKWKRTIELLRRSFYGPQPESTPGPVGLPDGPILRNTGGDPVGDNGPNWPISIVIGDYRCIARGEELNIRGPSGSETMTPAHWLDCAMVSVGRNVEIPNPPQPELIPLAPKSPWIDGPPTLLFRQYAIEHFTVDPGKWASHGVSKKMGSLRVFAGTLQRIEVQTGLYYFAEPFSRLAPIIVAEHMITRHFLVPDVDGE
jgi:hypothetical protein